MISPVISACALAGAAFFFGVLSFHTPRRWLRFAMRIVAAWLIAIALLSAVIPLVITTPGYRNDHME